MDQNDDNDSQYNFNRLDNTRIHPECYITYTIVQKICCDALDADSNPDIYKKIIKKQMKNSKLDLLHRFNKQPQWIDLWEKGGRPSGK